MTSIRKSPSGAREQVADGVTFGAAGSGAQFEAPGLGNDSDAFASALLAAYASPARRLTVFAGEFGLTRQHNLPGPMTVAGAGRGRSIFYLEASFPFASANHALGYIGDLSGTDLVLVQDVAPGGNTMLFAPGTDVSAIAINDLVHLRSEDAWNPTINTTRKRGEWTKVTRIGADTNGATGSITAYNSTTKLQTFDGGGFTVDMVGKTLTIQGAATAVHNGTFLIAAFISATQVQVYNPRTGAAGVDANNGAIDWLGPSVSIYGMARDDYTVAATARARRVSLVDGFDVMDVEFRQRPAFGSIPSGGPPMLSFRGCSGVRVSGMRVAGHEGPGVVLENVYDAVIVFDSFDDLYDFSTAGDYGYGVLVGDSCEKIRVMGAAVDVCRHGFDTGRLRSASGPLTAYGVPRDTLFLGNQVVHATDAAFSSHEQGDGVAFVGNTVGNSDNVGFFMRALGSHLLANVVQWASGGVSLGSASASTPSYQAAGSHVLGNSMRNLPNVLTAAADFAGTGSGGGQGNGVGMTLSRVDHPVVVGNVVDGAGRAIIRLRKGTTRGLFRGNVGLDGNQDVNGGSTGSAAAIDTPRTGTVTAFAFAGTTVTATSSGWNPADVGSNITVTGCANPANNGTFPITATSSTTVSWTNAAGVAGDAGNYEDSSSSFNFLDDNFFANRPWNAADGACIDDRTWIAGALEYLWRNSGTTAVRNLLTRLSGIAMTGGNQTDASALDQLASNINARPAEDDAYTWIENDQVANVTNATNTYTQAGFDISLDLSKYPATKGNKVRRVYFVSILSSLAGNQVDSRVFNSTAGASVGVSTASTTSLTPARVRVGPLTTNLTEGQATYQIQFRRGGAAETATYYRGRLEIAYE